MPYILRIATGAGSFSIVVDSRQQAIARLEEFREVGCPVAIRDLAGTPIDEEALLQAKADGTPDGPDSRPKR